MKNQFAWKTFQLIQFSTPAAKHRYDMLGPIPTHSIRRKLLYDVFLSSLKAEQSPPQIGLLKVL